MTLESYSPNRLDELALRLLDLSAAVRRMAHLCREEQIESIPLHDKKVQEWLSKLEKWLVGSQANLDTQIIRAKAERRARELVRG